MYIGIDNDMSVVGVTHLHQSLEDIPNKIVVMMGVTVYIPCENFVAINII